MNITEYQELAARTCPDLGSNYLNRLHFEVGVLTEIGELADIFKKKLAYNKELDLVHIGEEIADVCWYEVNKLGMYNSKTIEPKLDMIGPMDDHEIITSLLHYKEFYVLDLMYNIAVSLGLDFYKLLENNINKLKIRYPNKFDAEKALNRDLESERKELEK